MAPTHRHRAQAVARCLVDGLLVGGGAAALDLPPRSRPRALAYAALALLAGVDGLVRELPPLREALRGVPPQPRPAGDQEAEVQEAVRTVACGLVVTLVGGPVGRELRRHGHRRPHLVIGVVAGLVTAALTAPVHARRATARAAEDRAAAELDAELVQLLTESSAD